MKGKTAAPAALLTTPPPDPASATSPARARRWLTIGLPAAAILVLGAGLLITGGALGSALPVHLTPATMVSPMRSGAGPLPGGDVGAPRQAALASQGTGRRGYMG